MVTPHNKKNNLILANEWLYRGRKAQDFYGKLFTIIPGLVGETLFLN